MSHRATRTGAATVRRAKLMAKSGYKQAPRWLVAASLIDSEVKVPPNSKPASMCKGPQESIQFRSDILRDLFTQKYEMPKTPVRLLAGSRPHSINNMIETTLRRNELVKATMDENNDGAAFDEDKDINADDVIFYRDQGKILANASTEELQDMCRTNGISTNITPSNMRLRLIAQPLFEEYSRENGSVDKRSRQGNSAVTNLFKMMTSRSTAGEPSTKKEEGKDK